MYLVTCRKLTKIYTLFSNMKVLVLRHYQTIDSSQNLR